MKTVPSGELWLRIGIGDLGVSVSWIYISAKSVQFRPDFTKQIRQKCEFGAR